MSSKVPASRGNWSPLLAGALAVCSGTAFLLRPELLARRFSGALAGSHAFEIAARQAGGAYGWVLVLLGTAWLAKPWLAPKHRMLGLHALGWALLVALTLPLSTWWVDDAGITFAYSDNLIAGQGLVLQAGMPPEEAYSNTLWMLLLALAGLGGADIPAAAKVAGIAFGCASISLALITARRLTKEASLSASVLLSISLAAPFIVWSCSGLEHSLQAFLILAVAVAPTLGKNALALAAAGLSLLVLVRPETPLLAATTFAAWTLAELREAPGPHLTKASAIRALSRTWPLAVAPALTLATLLAFRVAYFGDPLPNPYYAKASDATFLRLLNPLGGAWEYVLGWLLPSGVVTALAFAAPWKQRAKAVDRDAALCLNLVLALVAAHLSFVLYAGGDWMGCWRFISPIVPALAVLGATFVSALSGAALSLARALVVLCVAYGTHTQYLAFAAAPTTPFPVVSAIAGEFALLGKSLGVQHPTLAHHDAGGTSYRSSIELVDLAGLGNRFIAKNMRNPAVLREYLLENRKPTFVFGASNNFAASTSRFHEDHRFLRDYVPVQFSDRPHLVADLCHVRRDAIGPDASRAGAIIVTHGHITIASDRASLGGTVHQATPP